MSEATLFRLAGWSAYFNATVFTLSLVALMLFFSVGGFRTGSFPGLPGLEPGARGA